MKQQKKKSIFVSVLCVLFLVTSVTTFNSFNSIKSMKTLNDIRNEISTIAVDEIIKLNEFNLNFNNLGRLLLSHITVTDKEQMKQLEQMIEKTLSEVEEALYAIEMKHEQPEEVEFIEQIKECFQLYKQDYQRVYELSKQDKDAKAVILMNEELNSVNVVLSTLISDFSNLYQDKISNAIEEGTAIYKFQIVAIYICGFGMIGFIVAAAFTILIRILKPLKESTATINKIVDDWKSGKADFTQRIRVMRNNEIGQMIMGMNVFIDNLQDMLKKMVENKEILNQSNDEMNHGAAIAKTRIEEISCTMQQLASGMEEVASSVSMMSSNTNDVSTSVDVMQDEVTQIKQLASDIREQASDLSEMSLRQRDKSTAMMTTIADAVESAITDSKKVEQINELTADILSISQQTNLLALNASIEAARAGEAGKGFAVVADEIRILADTSRETANNIQVISNVVNQSVFSLAESSDHLIEFIRDNVLKDYDNYVVAGEQYSEGAEKIDETMNQLASMTKNLQEVISEIAESFTQISATVQESTAGINNVSENTGDLVADVQGIVTQTKRNKEVSDDFETILNKIQSL